MDLFLGCGKMKKKSNLIKIDQNGSKLIKIGQNQKFFNLFQFSLTEHIFGVKTWTELYIVS